MNLAQVPEPAEPKDLLESLLRYIFGPDSWILYVFVFSTWLWAWYSLVVAGHARTRRVYSRVSSATAGATISAVFWMLLVAVAQGSYLALSYFIGANIRESVSGTEGPADVDFAKWFSGPASSPVTDPVFWVWFLVAVSMVAIGWASAQDSTLEGLRAFTWLPLACGFVACFVPFIVAAEEPDPLTVERMKVLGALIVAYEISALLSVYAPAICTAAWRKAENVRSR